jgi:phage-related protein
VEKGGVAVRHSEAGSPSYIQYVVYLWRVCWYSEVVAPDENPDAQIAWEGNSKEVISAFPDEVKQNLGFQLRRLQCGEAPTDYRPMPSIGPGVFELRDEDERSWYRVIYLSRINNVIHVLHCFEKKGRETPKNELKTARQRLAAVKQRLIAERRHAKPQ